MHALLQRKITARTKSNSARAPFAFASAFAFVFALAALCAFVCPASASADNSATAKARVGGAAYESLASAVFAAGPGQTVELLADVNLSESLEITKELTLDLGGHTLSSSEGVIIARANLTVQNGTISSDKWCIWMKAGAEPDVEDADDTEAGSDSDGDEPSDSSAFGDSNASSDGDEPSESNAVGDNSAPDGVGASTASVSSSNANDKDEDPDSEPIRKSDNASLYIAQDVQITAHLQAAVIMQNESYAHIYGVLTGPHGLSAIGECRIYIHDGALLESNDGHYGLALTQGAQAIIYGGTIGGSTTESGVFVAGNGTTATVLGGTISGKYGISGLGSSGEGGTRVIIRGGTVTGTTYAGIYYPQRGCVLISGGEVTGATSAVEMRSGLITVTGGTLTSAAQEYSVSAATSGITTTGAALAVAQHTTKNPLEVTIKGGTFTAPTALSEANPLGNEKLKFTIAIYGGTFEGEISVEDAKAFIHDGTFSVEPKEQYMAKS